MWDVALHARFWEPAHRRPSPNEDPISACVGGIGDEISDQCGLGHPSHTRNRQSAAQQGGLTRGCPHGIRHGRDLDHIAPCFNRRRASCSLAWSSSVVCTSLALVCSRTYPCCGARCCGTTPFLRTTSSGDARDSTGRRSPRARAELATLCKAGRIPHAREADPAAVTLRCRARCHVTTITYKV